MNIEGENDVVDEEDTTEYWLNFDDYGVGAAFLRDFLPDNEERLEEERRREEEERRREEEEQRELEEEEEEEYEEELDEAKEQLEDEEDELDADDDGLIDVLIEEPQPSEEESEAYKALLRRLDYPAR